MKPVNIFFIGRKQGVGLRRLRLSHLENRRPAELEGLRRGSMGPGTSGVYHRSGATKN